MPLTDTRIRNAKPRARPYKLSDGKGLHLEMRPNGSKLWRYRYRINGKENVFAVGAYYNDKRRGHLSLDQARRCREEAREIVKRGVHPAHHRKQEQFVQRAEASNTFELLASEWLAQKKTRWSPQRTRWVESCLKADVFPVIGRLPIRKVTPAHLLGIMRRVQERGAETVALLIRQWCSAIFRYAAATLRAEADPAGALKGAITPPMTRHHTPMSGRQLVTFNERLDAYGGNRTTVIAFRLMLLTFVRTKELRLAEWSEVDVRRAEWRIPAERTKMRDAQIVHSQGKPWSWCRNFTRSLAVNAGCFQTPVEQTLAWRQRR
jgi:hypothetical protein